MNNDQTENAAQAEKLQGPDDLYAAPDQQTAQKKADLHNAAMKKFLDAEPNRRSDLFWRAGRFSNGFRD